MTQHYFSANEGDDFEEIIIDVVLCGQNYRLKSANGVFSAHGVDKGTAVLLDFLVSSRGKSALSGVSEFGKILDIGCGWGSIALTAGMLFPKAQIEGVDVNNFAVELTNRNAKIAGTDNVKAYLEENLPDVLGNDTTMGHRVNETNGANDVEGYSLLLSNPPIRIGKPKTLALLDKYLARMAPNGLALFVIQKNLGADSIATSLNDHYHCEKLASSKGFRILGVRK